MGVVLTMKENLKKRIVVGISGASGAPIAVEVLRRLRADDGVEVHLIVTKSAALTIESEAKLSVEEVEALADYSYDMADVGARPASGSYHMDAMIVVPCSMKTVAGIHSGYADNLLLRAADVMMKEHGRLVLVARESPLSPVHLRNMYELSMMGVQIVPPMLTYYNDPQSLADCTKYSAERILRQVGLGSGEYEWQGM